MTYYRTTLNGDTFEIFGAWQSTRNGFAHKVDIQKNGYKISSAKTNYINRTWEAYEYRTTIISAIRKLLFDDNKDTNEQMQDDLILKIDRQARMF